MSRIPKFLLPFLPALAVFVVYWPSLQNGFVWDDTALVEKDPLIRSWRLAAEGFRHFLFLDATGSDFYRPVQRLTYTADYAIHGFNAGGYHLSNLIYHAAAATSLFFLIDILVRDAAGWTRRRQHFFAAACASIWAVHPIHSSAVIYVSGRADLLAGFFVFSGLSLALRDVPVKVLRPGWKTLAAAVLLGMACLSKEIGIVGLPILLAFLITRKRKQAAQTWLVIGVVIAGFYALLRLSAEQIEPPAVTPGPAPVRPILAARAVAEYSGLLALPVNLRMERDLRSATRGRLQENLRQGMRREYQTLAGVVIAGALAVWLVRSRRRFPRAFELLVAGIIAYLPVSNLIPLNAAAAEHWLYLPSAFFIAAIGRSLLRLFDSRLSDYSLPLRVGVTALTACWFAFLACRTYVRCPDWRDQRTFLERTIRDGGDSARMLLNQGNLEFKEGNLDLALEHYAEAERRQPDWPSAKLATAVVLVRKGDLGGAERLLASVADVDSAHAERLQQMAIIEQRTSRGMGLALMKEATEHAPWNWELRRRYILLLRAGGTLESALRELRSLLETQWYRAASWSMMGDLLAEAGKSVEARQAYERSRLYDVRYSSGGRKLDAVPEA